jgi:predicted transcriptional regulator
VRYDNESGRGDHRHVAGREELYQFISVAKLRRDFEADIRNYGGCNEEKIEVTVGDLLGALDRFEQAWQHGVAGTSRGGEVRLTFDNLLVLLKNLTPVRWKLLEAVKRSGPMSINELARLLGRNYKNVHTDVTRLVALGLIERAPNQRIAVAWDTITAEMKLAA